MNKHPSDHSHGKLHLREPWASEAETMHQVRSIMVGMGVAALAASRGLSVEDLNRGGRREQLCQEVFERFRQVATAVATGDELPVPAGPLDRAAHVWTTANSAILVILAEHDALTGRPAAAPLN